MSDSMLILARLHALEIQNRRLRGLCVAVLAVVAAALVAGAKDAGGDKAIETESIRIKGRDGRVVATLGTLEAGTGLHLYDAQGRPCATFSVNADGPALGLTDPLGRSATLSATRRTTGLAVTYPSSEIAAALGVTQRGPDLALVDPKGKTLFHKPE